MIFPWLNGIKGFSESPFTWILIFMNFFWFFVTSEKDPKSISKLNQADTQWVIQVKEQMFEAAQSDWLAPYMDPAVVPEIAAFRLALEPQFIEALKGLDFVGDPIEFEYRKNKLTKTHNDLRNRKIESFGYIPLKSKLLSYFSYQFMHSGWAHLLSNLMMLLIFGIALEKRFGSETLLAIYLIAGISGALLFGAFDPLSTTPLIGASASVTGIIGAFLISEKRRTIPYFYFLGFNQVGKIYLPPFLLFFYFFIDDLASWLASDQWLGSGVAHLAHIGGFFSGVIVVLLLKLAQSQFQRGQYAR